jgi:precorrin-8X/cobalt-precorrin-8 methylmutase
MAEAAAITRSMANIRHAARCNKEGIYIIGNAPTALYELLSLAETQKVRPALVIGVPVGFVGAKEAKDELMQSSLPYISTRGRKGGSTVAVAIVNALLYLFLAEREWETTPG